MCFSICQTKREQSISDMVFYCVSDSPRALLNPVHVSPVACYRFHTTTLHTPHLCRSGVIELYIHENESFSCILEAVVVGAERRRLTRLSNDMRLSIGLFRGVLRERYGVIRDNSASRLSQRIKFILTHHRPQGRLLRLSWQ